MTTRVAESESVGMGNLAGIGSKNQNRKPKLDAAGLVDFSNRLVGGELTLRWSASPGSQARSGRCGPEDEADADG